MVKLQFIFLFFLIASILAISVFYLTSQKGTTEISTGNFNSFLGNEVIEQNINLKNYIIEAQNKVSKIITEEVEIPLTIRSYSLEENVIAQASMYNKYNVRAGGLIVVNSSISLSDPSRWTNIIVHEILHVLGVGTSDKWDDSVVTIGSEKFLDRELFPHSARTYDNLIRRGLISGNIGSPIPLSDGNDSYPDGGAHLDEIIFDTEVMTPIADQINVISSLSIAILEDLGFEVSYSENEDSFL